MVGLLPSGVVVASFNIRPRMSSAASQSAGRTAPGSRGRRRAGPSSSLAELDLPDDIVVLILSKLGADDVARAAATCQSWRAVASSRAEAWARRYCALPGGAAGRRPAVDDTSSVTLLSECCTLFSALTQNLC